MDSSSRLFVVLLVQLVKKLIRIGFYFPNSRKATPFHQTPPSKETTGSQGMGPEELTAAIIQRLVEVERIGKATEVNSNRMEALEEKLTTVDAANTKLRAEVTQLKEDAEELEDRLRNKDAELQGILREMEQKQTEMQLNLTKVESATAKVLKSPDNLIPLHRYYNAKSGDHLYFLYNGGWGKLEAGRGGYAYEGVACKVLKDGTAEGSVPLHRSYNSRNGNHMYTTSREDIDGAAEYKYEDIQGYVFETQKPGTVPMYRYYHGTSGDNFYTTNWEELGNGVSGYKLEKIACYVYPSSDM